MKGTERNAYPTYQFSQLLPCVGQGLSLLGRPAGSQVGNLFCTLYLFWGGLSWKDFLHIYLPCYLPRVYLWIIIHYVYHLWILIDLGILWGSDDISMELLRRYVGRSVIMMMKRNRRKKKPLNDSHHRCHGGSLDEQCLMEENSFFFFFLWGQQER